MCCSLWAGSRQKQLNKALERAPPKSFLDAMEALQGWIEGVELLLDSEPFVVNNMQILNDNLVQYKVGLHTLIYITDWWVSARKM